MGKHGAGRVHPGRRILLCGFVSGVGFNSRQSPTQTGRLNPALVAVELARMNPYLRLVGWMILIGLAIHGAWCLWQSWVTKSADAAWESRPRIGFQPNPKPEAAP